MQGLTWHVSPVRSTLGAVCRGELQQADLELRFWCTKTIDWPMEMIFCKYSLS